MSNPTNTIILLSLPPKTFIGINLSTFSSSPNFRGINNLPTGLHFLYTGTDASLSIRHGHWLNIPLSSSWAKEVPVHVFEWNADGEYLDPLPPESSEAKNAVRGLSSLARGLVDYNALREASVKLQSEQTASSTLQGQHGDEDGARENELEDTDIEGDPWLRLTSHISQRLLDRILHAQTVQSSNETSGGGRSMSWTLTSISSAPGDIEAIPGLNNEEVDDVLNPTQTLNLLPIDLKKTWDESDVGRTRTERARDRTWYLSHLLSTLQTQKDASGSNLTTELAAKDYLGEIQYTFLMVLCLANYSCLEQWKRLLSVLLTCQTALSEVQGFFVETIAVLRCQLGRVDDVEGGLFEMADETGSAWLRRLLKGFRENVHEADVSKGEGKLREALNGLDGWLRGRYGWEDEKNVLRRGMMQLEDGEMVELQADGVDEDEETGEYAPVVVDI